MKRLIAFDLDGTLTQHKTPLDLQNRQVLDRLREKGYRLLMVGAGQCRRIFNQMGNYPLDIIGNYGMQFYRYDAEAKDILPVFDHRVDCDRPSVESRVTALRERFGFTSFRGENVEFHPSGCVTFPVLGTKALQADKLAFDPDRKKRRAIYAEVVAAFPEYTVFVGGSSSFDMAPKPYHKRYALENYCRENGFSIDEAVFVGDDYGPGGNDESVYRSEFDFLCVDDYRRLSEALCELL